MGLIERLPQQPHHIRLKTHDKESRTGIQNLIWRRWVVTSGNISTGTIPQVPRRSGLPIESPPFPEQLTYQNRATSVQYPGPFGVKSPPIGFKPS